MGFQEQMREEITNKIIDSLKEGVSPWRKPWVGGGLPTNVASKKRYRGINVLLLSIHQHQHKLTSSVYGTFNQWKQAGCMVRKRPEDCKGGYGAGIIFYQQLKGKKKQEDGTEKKFTFPMMKTYTVFNADQVEGASEYLAKRTTATPKTPAELHDNAESIIKCYLEREGIKTSKGNRACYNPVVDEVTMPERADFVLGTNSYYGTWFHELAHSTGHQKRLDRLDKFARFGSEAYAMEELVAEIGGCYLLGAAGLPVVEKLENHASYLENWLSVLKGDHKAVFQASTAAANAADCILKASGLLEDEEVEEVATV